MLTQRPLNPLVAQHLQRADDAGAGLAGSDHPIQVAPRCRDVGIGELFTVVARQLLPQAVRIIRCLQFPAKDDVHRSLRPHHGDLRPRPGQANVTTQMFGTHNDVGPTVGLAGDD